MAREWTRRVGVRVLRPLWTTLVGLLLALASSVTQGLPDLNPIVLPGEEIRIGGILPLNNVTGSPCYALAAIYAVADVNNGTIMSMPSNQALLLPTHRMRIFLNDSQADSRKSLAATLWQLENHQVLAVVGEVTSGVTAGMATLVSAFETPVVAPLATLQDFSNKDIYPYFARVVGGDDRQAKALHAVMLGFGWTTAQLIYATDTYGTGFATNLQAVAAASPSGTGVQFVKLHSFETGVNSSILTALQDMIADGSPIVVILGSHSKDARLIAAHVARLGILGQYQFVGCDGWLHPGVIPGTAAADLPAFKAFLAGTVGTMPLVAGKVAQQLNRRIQRNDAHLDPTSYLARVSPSCALSQTTSAYVYDSVIAIAVAASQVDESTTQLSGSSVMTQLLGSLRFEGITGPVILNEDGDRLASYSLTNYQPTDADIVSVGMWIPTPGDEADGAGVITFDRKLVFAGGSLTPPPSVRPNGITSRISSQARWGMIAGSILFTFVFAMLPLLVVLHYRENIAIKSSNVRLLAMFLVGIWLGGIYPSIDSMSRLPEDGHSTMSLCLLPYFLLAISFDLIFSSLLTKTWTIYLIHTNNELRVLRMGWWRTLRVTIFLVALDFLIFGIWAGYDMPQLEPSAFISHRDDYLICAQNYALVWELLIFVPKFLLLAATAYVAFKSREVPHAFNESRFIALILYNLTLIALLVIVLDVVVTEPASSLIITSAGVWFCIAISSLLLMGPKFLILAASLRKTHERTPSVSSQHSTAFTDEGMGVRQEERLQSVLDGFSFLGSMGPDGIPLMSRYGVGHEYAGGEVAGGGGPLSAYVLKMAKEGGFVVTRQRHSHLRASLTTDDEDGQSSVVPTATTSIQVTGTTDSPDNAITDSPDNATSPLQTPISDPSSAPLVYHGSASVQPASLSPDAPVASNNAPHHHSVHHPAHHPVRTRSRSPSHSIAEVRFHVAYTNEDTTSRHPTTPDSEPDLEAP